MALQQKRCELEELGCGGCALLSLPYEKQLQKKQKELKALLGKYRKLHPILGMECTLEEAMEKETAKRNMADTAEQAMRLFLAERGKN